MPSSGNRTGRPTPLSGFAQSRAGRVVTSIWFAPLVLTVAICAYRINSIAMWWDELASVDIASRSLSQILSTLRHVDAVHGVYYLLLHFWMTAFGQSALAIRFPSLLAMAGAAVLTALIAERLFSRLEARIAGPAFALLPAVTRYGTEARSYAMVTFVAALATYLLLRCLERGSWRRWSLYALAIAVLGLLNLVSLSLLLGHLAGLLFLARRSGGYRALSRFAPAALVGILLDFPVIWYGHREVELQLADLPKVTLSSLVTMWPAAACSTAAAIAVFGALVLAWFRRDRGPVGFVVCLAVLPYCMLWAVSLGSVNYFHYARYFVFLMPAWAVALGALGGMLRSVRLAAVGVVALAVAVLPAQVVMHGRFAHFEYNYPVGALVPDDYRAAAAIIAQNHRPGDEGTFGEQINIPEGLAYYLPGSIRLPDMFVAESSVKEDNLSPVYCADSAECAQDAGPRIWVVVLGHFSASDPLAALAPDQAAALREYYRVDETKYVSGLTIALLDRRG